MCQVNEFIRRFRRLMRWMNPDLQGPGLGRDWTASALPDPGLHVQVLQSKEGRRLESETYRQPASPE
jgi:hypothetical protein